MTISSKSLKELGKAIGGLVATLIQGKGEKKPPPTKFLCPYCRDNFPTFEEAEEHVQNDCILFRVSDSGGWYV